jgi:hypothetical protein
MVDGHMVLVVGGGATYAATVHGVMRKGWFKQFCNIQPVVAGSLLLFTTALLLPITVPPLRRKFGMATEQWDAYEHNTTWTTQSNDQRRKVVKKDASA